MIRTRSDIAITPLAQSGTDADIADAARVSTDRPADRSRDPRLIASLLRHRHGTPFEHGMLRVRVECPVFVARQWFRHRIGWSYSEKSLRYTVDDELEFWVPPDGRPCAEPDGFNPMSPVLVDRLQTRQDAERHLHAAYTAAANAYRTMIRLGVAREVARAALGTGVYTAFVATCNPRSLMTFLALRDKPNAQAEAQECARQLAAMLWQFWPLTAAAFTKYGVAP